MNIYDFIHLLQKIKESINKLLLFLFYFIYIVFTIVV